MESLKELNLSHNQLIELPESFGNLQSLQWLSLQSNKLTKLSGSFSRLKKLKNLNLDENLWVDEFKEVLEKEIDNILEYCWKNGDISIYIKTIID